MSNIDQKDIKGGEIATGNDTGGWIERTPGTGMPVGLHNSDFVEWSDEAGSEGKCRAGNVPWAGMLEMLPVVKYRVIYRYVAELPKVEQDSNLRKIIFYRNHFYALPAGEYAFIATDKSGGVFLYMTKPIAEDTGWIPNAQKDCRFIGAVPDSKIFGNIADWRDSLMCIAELPTAQMEGLV